MLYPQYKKIPNRLRKCRIASGLEPEVVAKILGLKRTSKISSWETGACVPTLVNAFRLASVYKVYVEDIFFDLMHETRKEITAKADEVLYQKGRDDKSVSTPGITSKPM